MAVSIGLALATLLVHHPAKGDGTEGRAPRGSGALMGAVECLMEFRRFDAADPEDTRRVITAYSRFPETPDKVVVNWLGIGRGYVRDDGYTVAKKRQEAREPIIDEILKGRPLSKAAILKAFRDDEDQDPIGDKTLQRGLKAGVASGRWICDGKARGVTYRMPNEDPEVHDA